VLVDEDDARGAAVLGALRGQDAHRAWRAPEIVAVQLVQPILSHHLMGRKGAWYVQQCPACKPWQPHGKVTHREQVLRRSGNCSAITS